MTVKLNKSLRCDGYPKNGTYVIDYKMPSLIKDGISIPSTYRTAYIPDTKEGKEVVELLKIAFDRKLMFTIGRSVTTGYDN